MRATERIKGFCSTFSTLGALGEWWLGGLVASIFAIPLLLFFQSIYWFSFHLFAWTLVFTIALFLIVIQCTIFANREKAQDIIVLDKIIGVMIALAGVSLRWRIIFFGFLLFHLLNTVKPFLWYRKVLRRVDHLPGIFGILGSDILSGVVVNIFLQVMAWVMG